LGHALGRSQGEDGEREQHHDRAESTIEISGMLREPAKLYQHLAPVRRSCGFVWSGLWPLVARPAAGLLHYAANPNVRDL
jgi:hypothetical protein